jgi:hypothetical protein
LIHTETNQTYIVFIVLWLHVFFIVNWCQIDNLVNKGFLYFVAFHLTVYFTTWIWCQYLTPSFVINYQYEYGVYILWLTGQNSEKTCVFCVHSFSTDTHMCCPLCFVLIIIVSHITWIGYLPEMGRETNY